MSILLTFKRSLFKYLSEAESLQAATITSAQPEVIAFPNIKMTKMIVDNWQAYELTGRVIEAKFEVVSDTESSAQAITLADEFTEVLIQYRPLKEEFVILKNKNLTREIKYLKQEKLWAIEVGIKFWLELLN